MVGPLLFIPKPGHPAKFPSIPLRLLLNNLLAEHHAAPNLGNMLAAEDDGEDVHNPVAYFSAKPDTSAATAYN